MKSAKAKGQGWYWVEGVFLTKRGLKKAQKSSKLAAGDREPFAKAFWASSPEEAERLATEELQGGQWLEGPRVSRTTEEQRMRKMGAPELPL